MNPKLKKNKLSVHHFTTGPEWWCTSSQDQIKHYFLRCLYWSHPSLEVSHFLLWARDFLHVKKKKSISVKPTKTNKLSKSWPRIPPSSHVAQIMMLYISTFFSVSLHHLFTTTQAHPDGRSWNKRMSKILIYRRTSWRDLSRCTVRRYKNKLDFAAGSV